MATETTGQAEGAAQAAAEHSGGMPQLDGSTWASQIFWTALALFILYKVLTKTILPRISGALEDRHNAIADDLDAAAELKKQAETATAAHADALLRRLGRKLRSLSLKTKRPLMPSWPQQRQQPKLTSQPAQRKAKSGSVKFVLKRHRVRRLSPLKRHKPLSTSWFPDWRIAAPSMRLLNGP